MYMICHPGKAQFVIAKAHLWKLFSCNRVNKLLPEVARRTAIELMVG